MRFKEHEEPFVGQWRRVRKFLLFPKNLRIGGTENTFQVRWLEFDFIDERFSAWGEWEEMFWAPYEGK